MTMGIVSAGPVWAFSTGNIGVSGKQGNDCNACHAGGTAPTVSFEGPTQLEPGAQGTFTFRVQSNAPGQTAAGLDLASSDGELDVVAGQGTRRAQFQGSFEVTHTTPKANTDGVATWQFTWRAPASEGTSTLFGAGNSVNLNAQSFGDRSSTITLAVMVSAAVPTPTFTPTTVGETPTPTPTLGPVPCVGDCDDNGAVAINELILGVNIALEVTLITECPAFDTDGSEQVSVNELVAGVNAALGECE
jgi:hypothetical protein